MKDQFWSWKRWQNIWIMTIWEDSVYVWHHLEKLWEQNALWRHQLLGQSLEALAMRTQQVYEKQGALFHYFVQSWSITTLKSDFSSSPDIWSWARKNTCINSGSLGTRWSCYQDSLKFQALTSMDFGLLLALALPTGVPAHMLVYPIFQKRVTEFLYIQLMWEPFTMRWPLPKIYGA